jgi:putative membrane protein
MAWVRTATSLISFAFTIYKFFQYVRESQPAAPPQRMLDPRAFALAMIGLGFGSLILATLQHRHDLRALEAQFGPLPPSTAAIVASVVSALGLLTLILVLLRQ